MQVTGMLYGGKMLQFVDFPTSEVLGPEATEDAIKALIDRCGSVFVKPIFKGGVGKKGNRADRSGQGPENGVEGEGAALFRRASSRQSYAKAHGVTFEGAVPAENEVYFSITDSTRSAPGDDPDPSGRRRHRGVGKEQVANIPFDPLTGLKAFVVANALSELGRRRRSSRPWSSICRSCGSFSTTTG